MARVKKHSAAWFAKRRKIERALRVIVAANCRKARAAAGLTQRQVSELFGATEGYYRGIEAGTKSFSLVRVIEIADALGVTVGQLLEGL